MRACPATASAPRTSRGRPGNAAPTSARSTTSGSSTASSASKSPSRAAAKNASTTLRCAARSASGAGVPALDAAARAAGELARGIGGAVHDRRDLVERHARTCRAARMRAARPGLASRGRRAAPARPSRRAAPRAPGRSRRRDRRSGRARATSSGSSRRVPRDRSMFSDTRATTVVSHASRFSIAPASVRLQPQPRLLDGVVGLAQRAEHPVGHRPQPGPLLLESLCQGVAFVHRSRSSAAWCLRDGPANRGRCDTEGDTPCEFSSRAPAARSAPGSSRSSIDHGHEVVGTAPARQRRPRQRPRGGAGAARPARRGRRARRRPRRRARRDRPPGDRAGATDGLQRTSTAASRRPTGCGRRAPTRCSPPRGRRACALRRPELRQPRYARAGGPVKTEDDPLDPNPARRCARPRGDAHLDQAVTEAGGIALRYGGFYGAANDGMVEPVRKRMFPIVGDGGGDDVVHPPRRRRGGDRPRPRPRGGGIFNIVDDDPAPTREWLPVLAEVLGAKPPRHVPRWLAKLVAGEAAVMHGDRVARRLQREGQARAGLGAAVPELATGLRGRLRAGAARQSACERSPDPSRRFVSDGSPWYSTSPEPEASTPDSRGTEPRRPDRGRRCRDGRT